MIPWKCLKLIKNDKLRINEIGYPHDLLQDFL